MKTTESDLNSRTDYPGGIDDETLALLLGDAATVLGKSKLNGLARAVELGAVILFGKPAHGEPFVEDIAVALDACARLSDALADVDEETLVELGIDGHVAEVGQAIMYCSRWGLDPGLRADNAIRTIARTLDTIRGMAVDARAETTGRVDSRNLALESIARTVDTLLAALGIQRVDDEVSKENRQG